MGSWRKRCGFGWPFFGVLLLFPLWLQAARAASPAGLEGDQPGPTFTVPAKDIPAHWTVIAYGDTRFTDIADQSVGNAKARRWLVNRIAEEHPDAVLVSGDIPYNGANAGDYNVFRDETASWRGEGLRVYPALGNHELHGGEAQGLSNWWTAFPELRGRRWYSVLFGNAYFIVLDSNSDLGPGSPQQLWLAAQLAQLPKQTQFVFLELHHPPVADTIVPQIHLVRTNEASLASMLNAAAPKLRARLVVIAGHVHNYERFEQSGVEYLVSGGGGAKPYMVTRDLEDLYKNPSAVNFHYVRLHFDGKALQATMYRVDSDAEKPSWEARDSFTLAAR